MGKQKEGPARWTGNFPRKGWTIATIFQMDNDEYEHCYFCGTTIRQVFVLEHNEDSADRYAGCVCVEHLTEDYYTPRKMLSDLQKRKRAHAREQQKKWASIAALRLGLYWGERPNGNFVAMHPHTKKPVTIFQTRYEPGKWSWVHDNRFGQKYQTVNETQLAAEDQLSEDLEGTIK